MPTPTLLLSTLKAAVPVQRRLRRHSKSAGLYGSPLWRPPLVANDIEIMKEVVFASAKMSRRLVAKEEMAFCADETNSPIPSFLRKKTSEGKGRNKP
jgi:hypothetical protein